MDPHPPPPKKIFKWEDRHYSMVEESEKMLRNHKQGDEIDI